jgi:hypothetical protein
MPASRKQGSQARVPRRVRKQPSGPSAARRGATQGVYAGSHVPTQGHARLCQLKLRQRTWAVVGHRGQECQFLTLSFEESDRGRSSVESAHSSGIPALRKPS